MALLLKLHQVGGGVVVAIPSLVTKNIDQKGRGISRESLLGNEFLVADGALDEIPFTVLPFALGGREIDPRLGELALALVLGVDDAGVGLGFRSMQLGQGGSVLDDTVGELPDFGGIVPSATMSMDHPGTHTQATVTPGRLG